ncbi:hypothetical protein LO772_34990 [Yinghuangia sp. ASG 101]|nr:hypothetical protein [Yinghuangia sp. ASG 101]UGQ11909.1 hypothetical protein LO772_34990 [Yinghuangia sp. ASG 101]
MGASVTVEPDDDQLPASGAPFKPIAHGEVMALALDPADTPTPPTGPPT